MSARDLNANPITSGPDLVRDFESCTLAPAAFGHRQHIPFRCPVQQIVSYLQADKRGPSSYLRQGIGLGNDPSRGI